ncbi:MAG: hypothetical protein DMF61_01405 [Blastocatellia bacterium AA13]|nr:MAG: hypothetical protein DMF61_01405 [Blastocatellia bacterium AA13]
MTAKSDMNRQRLSGERAYYLRSPSIDDPERPDKRRRGIDDPPPDGRPPAPIDEPPPDIDSVPPDTEHPPPEIQEPPPDEEK